MVSGCTNVSNLMAVLKSRKEVGQMKKVAGAVERKRASCSRRRSRHKNVFNSFLRYNDEMLMQTVMVLMSVN